MERICHAPESIICKPKMAEMLISAAWPSPMDPRPLRSPSPPSAAGARAVRDGLAPGSALDAEPGRISPNPRDDTKDALAKTTRASQVSSSESIPLPLGLRSGLLTCFPICPALFFVQILCSAGVLPLCAHGDACLRRSSLS